MVEIVHVVYLLQKFFYHIQAEIAKVKKKGGDVVD